MPESKIYNNNKEKCELCRKFICTYDIILVCSNDHKPYHAKCLKLAVIPQSKYKSRLTGYVQDA